MSSSVERAAQNEALFRNANERIEQRLEDLSLAEGRVPFVCECDDVGCTEMVRLTLEQYEAVRAVPTHFVGAPGHPFAAGRIVHKEDDFIVVEKTGEAGRIAEETDPRQ